MLFSNSMPQTYRSTANTAAMIPVIKTILPIGSREITGQIAFTCSLAMFTNIVSYSSLWSFPVNSIVFSDFMGVILASFSFAIALNFSKFFPIAFAVSALDLSIVFWVFCTSNAITFLQSLVMLLVEPTRISGLLFFGAGFLRLRCTLNVAFLASEGQRVASFIEIFECNRKFFSAFLARAKGHIHSVSLSLYLMMRLANGEIIRLSGASLANISIIPQVDL